MSNGRGWVGSADPGHGGTLSGPAVARLRGYADTRLEDCVSRQVRERSAGNGDRKAVAAKWPTENARSRRVDRAGNPARMAAIENGAIARQPAWRGTLAKQKPFPAMSKDYLAVGRVRCKPVSGKCSRKQGIVPAISHY